MKKIVLAGMMVLMLIPAGCTLSQKQNSQEGKTKEEGGIFVKQEKNNKKIAEYSEKNTSEIFKNAGILKIPVLF